MLRRAREAAERKLKADQETKRNILMKEREISIREMKERKMRIQKRQKQRRGGGGSSSKHMRHTGNGGKYNQLNVMHVLWQYVNRGNLNFS